jgi:hypothetical protein
MSILQRNPTIMYREHRKRFLERAALREARKALRRSSSGSFTKDDMLHLRIQTLEPWLRILVIIIGLVCWGAIWLITHDAGTDINIWVLLLLGFLGLFFVGTGVFGWKKTVEEVLGMLGEAVISNLLDSLF